MSKKSDQAPNSAGIPAPAPESRADRRTPVELKVEYEQLNAFFADYAKNIGRGGTFIESDSPLELGSEFEFTMVIPNREEPLRLKGRVQWRITPEDASGDQKAGMGVGFIYKNEAERAKVETIVDGLMIDSLGETLHEKLLEKSGLDF